MPTKPTLHARLRDGWLPVPWMLFYAILCADLSKSELTILLFILARTIKKNVSGGRDCVPISVPDLCKAADVKNSGRIYAALKGLRHKRIIRKLKHGYKIHPALHQWRCLSMKRLRDTLGTERSRGLLRDLWNGEGLVGGIGLPQAVKQDPDEQWAKRQAMKAKRRGVEPSAIYIKRYLLEAIDEGLPRNGLEEAVSFSAPAQLIWDVVEPLRSRSKRDSRRKTQAPSAEEAARIARQQSETMM